MRIKYLWPLGVVLIGLFTASCEDDPNDLDYLKAGSGGSSATAGSGGAAGAVTAAGAGGSAAGAAGH
jgi:hypothetical protein